MSDLYREAARDIPIARNAEVLVVGGGPALGSQSTTLRHHVVVEASGDAVMTRDFFAHRQGYFNSASFQQASHTIEEIARIADIVVPGHDNFFLVAMTPFLE